MTAHPRQTEREVRDYIVGYVVLPLLPGNV